MYTLRPVFRVGEISSYPHVDTKSLEYTTAGNQDTNLILVGYVPIDWPSIWINSNHACEILTLVNQTLDHL